MVRRTLVGSALLLAVLVHADTTSAGVDVSWRAGVGVGRSASIGVDVDPRGHLYRAEETVFKTGAEVGLSFDRWTTAGLALGIAQRAPVGIEVIDGSEWDGAFSVLTSTRYYLEIGVPLIGTVPLFEFGSERLIGGLIVEPVYSWWIPIKDSSLATDGNNQFGARVGVLLGFRSNQLRVTYNFDDVTTLREGSTARDQIWLAEIAHEFGSGRR